MIPEVWHHTMDDITYQTILVPPLRSYWNYFSSGDKQLTHTVRQNTLTILHQYRKLRHYNNPPKNFLEDLHHGKRGVYHCHYEVSHEYRGAYSTYIHPTTRLKLRITDGNTIITLGRPLVHTKERRQLRGLWMHKLDDNKTSQDQIHHLHPNGCDHRHGIHIEPIRQPNQAVWEILLRCGRCLGV